MALPAYEPAGILYVPNEDYSIRHAQQLHTVGGEWAIPTSVALAVEPLLAKLEGDYGTVAELMTCYARLQTHSVTE